MFCVEAPFDHMYAVLGDDVKVTEPPVQKVVGPLAVIVGVGGNAFTVTTCDAAALVQPKAVTVSVYVPAVDTVILCVVAPFDHIFPVLADEVRVTDPPAQKVVGPPAVIVGVGGVAFTVIVLIV